jgi:Ala-tRNA(Pro) deacylase
MPGELTPAEIRAELPRRLTLFEERQCGGPDQTSEAEASLFLEVCDHSVETEAELSLTDLTSLLDEAGIGYTLLPHDHTETAADEAAALGLPPSQVAKTLLVGTPGGYVRAVLPASERLDQRKLRDLLGAGKHIQLASEEDLAREYPEFELGAVPPLGGGRRDPVIVDRRLAQLTSLVVEAGSHDHSLRIQTADLMRLTEAQVADICQD